MRRQFSGSLDFSLFFRLVGTKISIDVLCSSNLYDAANDSIIHLLGNMLSELDVNIARHVK